VYNAGRDWLETWVGDDGTLRVWFDEYGLTQSTRFFRFVWFDHDNNGRVIGIRQASGPKQSRLTFHSWLGW
jgi:hypothetical protein